VLASRGIATPRFQVCVGGRPPRSLVVPFPAIVKPVNGSGSAGISQRSVVKTARGLRSRVAALHDTHSSGVIVEEYVDGRELTVGVLGTGRPVALPIWETFFGRLPHGAPRIATCAVKWNSGYRRERRVTSGPAVGLPATQRREIAAIALRAYKVLGLSGFARIDFRLDGRGRALVIDVNPNPDIGFGEDFARSAAHAGIRGPQLLQRIVDLALAVRR
jgi:D-alanine-D-alanine ligase